MNVLNRFKAFWWTEIEILLTFWSLWAKNPSKTLCPSSLVCPLALLDVGLNMSLIRCTCWDVLHLNLSNLHSFRGEMRFLQKIKFLPNVILMLETSRYILSHVKYKISSKNSTGKVTVFEILQNLMYFTSDWTSDWLKTQAYDYVMKDFCWFNISCSNM